MFFAFYVTAFYSKHSTGLSSLCSSGHRVTRLWVNLIRSAVVVQNRRDLFLDFMNRPLLLLQLHMSGQQMGTTQTMLLEANQRRFKYLFLRMDL